MRKPGALALIAGLALAGAAAGRAATTAVPGRIPAGVVAIDITDSEPGQTLFTLAVTQRHELRRIIRLVDELAEAPHGAASCPEDRAPIVKLAFEDRSDDQPLAVVTADGSGCGLVDFALRGRRQGALSDGPGLIDRLGALLEIRF